MFAIGFYVLGYDELTTPTLPGCYGTDCGLRQIDPQMVSGLDRQQEEKQLTW